jgi:hypothetical protein
MKQNMTSDEPPLPAFSRGPEYYVSVCEPVKEGDERPLDKLKRLIREARERSAEQRAVDATNDADGQVNTTKSE